MIGAQTLCLGHGHVHFMCIFRKLVWRWHGPPPTTRWPLLRLLQPSELLHVKSIYFQHVHVNVNSLHHLERCISCCQHVRPMMQLPYICPLPTTASYQNYHIWVVFMSRYVVHSLQDMVHSMFHILQHLKRSMSTLHISPPKKQNKSVWSLAILTSPCLGVVHRWFPTFLPLSGKGREMALWSHPYFPLLSWHTV